MPDTTLELTLVIGIKGNPMPSTTLELTPVLGIKLKVTPVLGAKLDLTPRQARHWSKTLCLA